MVAGAFLVAAANQEGWAETRVSAVSAVASVVVVGVAATPVAMVASARKA